MNVHTQRETARILGKSETAVSLAIKRGRLIPMGRSENGRAFISDEEIERYKKYIKTAKGGRPWKNQKSD